MIKKRLIFTLLFDNGNFMLSRNFRLQRVGDLDWIKKYYDFNSIAFSIDELVILNVERENIDINKFCEELKKLAKNYFMPLAAGGNIRSIEEAKKIFASGADKIIVNTPIFKMPELVKDFVNLFGSQSVIGSIDYKKEKDKAVVYTDKGRDKTNLSVREAIELSENLGVGEIYLNSIDKDGTGMGYDIETLKEAKKYSKVPIIAAGGVGKFEHFLEGIEKTRADAFATANLFYFMGDSLEKARKFLKERNIELAEWEYGFKTNKIGLFLTARVASTRLPKKMLIEIDGKPVLWWLIQRMKVVEKADLKVVCTSFEKEDDEIERISKENGWLCFRGDKEDVLLRYLKAASFYGIEFFVNVDGDDLFCSTEYVDKIIDIYHSSKADYIYIKGLPLGGAPIGVKVEALREVCNLKMEKDTQGWGKYFKESGLFNCLEIEAEEVFKKEDYRMTLDYEEDLEFFKKVILSLGIENLSLEKIIKFLDENPEIVKINQKANEKYWERFNKEHRKFKLKEE